MLCISGLSKELRECEI